MTDIRLTHPLKITASSCNVGDVVKIVNITNQGVASATLASGGKAIIDLANVCDYKSGDLVTVYINGKQVGGTTATISGSNNTVTVTTAAYAGPSVTI